MKVYISILNWFQLSINKEFSSKSLILFMIKMRILLFNLIQMIQLKLLKKSLHKYSNFILKLLTLNELKVIYKSNEINY